MYETIKKLADRLANLSVLNEELLLDISALIGDDDYRDYFLQQLAINRVNQHRFEDAGAFAKQLSGLDSSRVLTGIARHCVEAGNRQLASSFFSQAEQSVSLNRYPTERAIAFSEIAQALRECGLLSDAIRVFNLAIDVAVPAQVQEGIAGPEASGVILTCLRALQDLGQKEEVRSKAELITLPSARQLALELTKT